MPAMNSKNWWDVDDHPDAEAHREFVSAEIKKTTTPHAPKIVTDRVLDPVLEQIGRFVGEKFHALEERVRVLETREDGGVWEPGKSYAKGTIVSQDGSGWIATRDFPEKKPGEPRSGWRLFVKKGRDSK